MNICNDRELITLLHKRISNIYYERNIVPLRGFSDDETKLPYELPSGKKYISYVHDVLNGKLPIKEIINISDDFLFLSDEIIYFIALLYMYRPYIENQTEDAIITDDGMFYISDQTIEGKRYDMFVDILFEKIFSFCERLANIVAISFPNLFSVKENISFSKVIDKLASENSKNENFIWLLSFRNSEFKEMNIQRRNAVHNISTLTKNWNEQNFENFMSFSQTKKLQDKRRNYADYFLKLHNQCLIGLERTLDFLNTNNQIVKK